MGIEPVGTWAVTNYGILDSPDPPIPRLPYDKADVPVKRINAFQKYTYTSTRIFKMMLDYTPLVEVFSIDDAFLDVTHSLKIFGTPERIAYLMKAMIP